MARLQILELPMVHNGDVSETPFILVIDEYKAQRYIAGVGLEPQETNPFAGVAYEIGARGALVFEGTVEIPANNPDACEAEREQEVRPMLGDREVRNAIAADMQKMQDAHGRTESLRSARIEAEYLAVEAEEKLKASKEALLDALGMDRTRDWDDISNAIARLRKERDAQAKELERLRAGEEPGWDPYVEPTPGQWIGRWNEATPERRLDMAVQILDGMKRSRACFEADHEGQIARLKAASSRTSDA